MNEEATPKRKRKNKGQVVGEAIVKDIVTICNGEKPLTQKEKEKLVNSLETDAERIKYAEYRDLHDFIIKTVNICAIYEQRAGNSALAVTSLLGYLKFDAEELERRKQLPKIMTQKQVDDLKAQGYDFTQHSGIAILTAPVEGQVDEWGYYKEPAWIRFTSSLDKEVYRDAKDIIRHLKEDISKFKKSAVECFVLQQGIELLAKHYKLPTLQTILADNGKFLEAKAEHMNEMLSAAQRVIEAYGEPISDKEAKELRREIKILAEPIDASKLKPTKEAIKKVKPIVGVDMIRGYDENVYRVLRGDLLNV